ncbi:hypothetical protein SAMD00019534_074620, partial [Acytostelium subglobosum LB1]|uniref:hypothetical protein n=1 Tax=Acytostelium subglobosum LB1 TaxID=1410327 RepID=UPI0006448FF0
EIYNNNNNNNDLLDYNNTGMFANINNFTLYGSNPFIKSVSSEKMSEYAGSFYNKLPRYDIYARSINNTFNPNNSSYVESVLLTGAPFALVSLLAVLTIVFTSIGMIIYCICIRPKSKMHYQICFLLVGMFTNYDLDNAINVSIDNLQANIQDRSNIESRVVDEAVKLSIYHHLPYDAFQVISMTQDVLEWTNKSQEYIHHYEQIRYDFVGSSIMALLAAVALGLLAVLFRSRTVMIIFVTFGVILSTVLWVVPAAHVPMGVVISDICPQLQTIVQENVPEDVQPYVNFFLTCNDSTSFQFVDDMLASAIRDEETKLNYAIRHHYPNDTIDQLQFKIAELKNLTIDSKDILNCNITSIAYLSIQNIVCIEIL